MSQGKRDPIHLPRNLGEKIADSAVANIGSWGFIIAQAMLMAIWFILNTVGWFIWKWDLYPFVFLNLAMSAEAAFSSPIIMMSQNRQSARDRLRDDLEAQDVELDLSTSQQVLKLVQEIHTINLQQTEILNLLHGGKDESKP
jgi:uncharacterized membrane protein